MNVRHLLVQFLFEIEYFLAVIREEIVQMSLNLLHFGLPFKALNQNLLELQCLTLISLFDIDISRELAHSLHIGLNMCSQLLNLLEERLSHSGKLLVSVSQFFVKLNSKLLNLVPVCFGFLQNLL